MSFFFFLSLLVFKTLIFHLDALRNLILKPFQLKLLAFLGRRLYYLPMIVMRRFPKTRRALASASGSSAHKGQMLPLSSGLAQLVITRPGAGGQEDWVQRQAGVWDLWPLADISVACLPVTWPWEPAPDPHPQWRVGEGWGLVQSSSGGVGEEALPPSPKGFVLWAWEDLLGL